MHLWWSNVCACFLGMHKTKQIVVSHSWRVAEIISLAAGFSMESIFALTFWDHVVAALELLSLVQQEVTPCILVESRHAMQERCFATSNTCLKNSHETDIDGISKFFEQKLSLVQKTDRARCTSSSEN